eukprot:1257351-Amorphochlora_amoeboformis.AAC.1
MMTRKRARNSAAVENLGDAPAYTSIMHTFTVSNIREHAPVAEFIISLVANAFLSTICISTALGNYFHL